MIQSQIAWSVSQNMSREEFDAYAAGVAPINAKPIDIGIITLANGWKRTAEWRTGQFTGRRYLQYRTPAGNWRNASEADKTTFVPVSA